MSKHELPIGARVRLNKENSPRDYYMRQSKGDDGTIIKIDVGYWVLWDNGHTNCYGRIHLEPLCSTNRQSVWALKR